VENSIPDCLPYIQIPNGSCELFLAYPKWPCVCLKVNICITHCITSSLPECSISFHVSCDLWPSLSLCHLMWLMCDQVMLSLTLILSSKNIIKENKLKRKSKWEKKIGKTKSTSCYLDKIHRYIKNLFCSWDDICYNYNLFNIL